ncbi:Cell surface superoxide dismutase [Cu-Zn] 6 [Cytospora mali]|uniref:superoxide dismutase n=1 Tax=Cytospora mali TaxID=578113 RepID=A0A194VRQ5_CYTMA|nr:Cell surface superoxide dismutase [Cu-Zn] 6 [Valsa mali]
MRQSIIASLLTAVVSTAAQDVTAGTATVVTDNPAGAVYAATLPDTAFDTAAFPSGGNVKGAVYALSSPDGTGVIFQVKFSGLPSEGGPFLYHIHDQPVPADGNCTSTGGHLDPFSRGETPSCDSSAPATCQVGDLSGKYGTISSDPFAATYTDDYTSLESGNPAYFGNLSFVLHYANKTRITCANFAAVSTSSCGAGSSSSPSSSSPSTTAASAAASSATATGGGGLLTPTTGSPAGSNATATGSTAPSASSTIVQAGGSANAPALMLAVGAAVMAFVL